MSTVPKLAAALTVALLVPAHAGPILSFEREGESVTLYDERGDCPSIARRAVYRDSKGPSEGCWVEVEHQGVPVVAIVYFDGDRGMVKKANFRPLT